MLSNLHLWTTARHSCPNWDTSIWSLLESGVIEVLLYEMIQWQRLFPRLCLGWYFSVSYYLF